VDDIKEATSDYLISIEATNVRVKNELGLETTLVELPDGLGGESMWVIRREDKNLWAWLSVKLKASSTARLPEVAPEGADFTSAAKVRTFSSRQAADLEPCFSQPLPWLVPSRSQQHNPRRSGVELC